jgi:hypothetical protein
MESFSIDISAAADRLDLLCHATGPEITGRNAGGEWVLCCGGSDKLFYPFLLRAKDCYR